MFMWLVSLTTTQDKGIVVSYSIFFYAETAMNILKINLSHPQQNDQIFWCLSKSSSFSVKSAYMSIIQIKLTGPNPLSIKEWKGLWKLKVHACQIQEFPMEDCLEDAPYRCGVRKKISYPICWVLLMQECSWNNWTYFPPVSVDISGMAYGSMAFKYV